MNSLRFLNKQINENERNNFRLWWKELINIYGITVTYYIHDYSFTRHDYLYGEDPTSPYLSAGEIVILADITNDSILLSKFGVMADCDMNAIIHIESFQERFGMHAEPKAGDLIKLTEYGVDRLNNRGAPIYEITERDDENLPLTNSLIGHYVWFCKTKRFEFSFEKGISPEEGNKQINDSGLYGLTSNLLSSYSLSTDDVNVKGKEIFNYECTNQDSPYGDY